MKYFLQRFLIRFAVSSFFEVNLLSEMIRLMLYLHIQSALSGLILEVTPVKSESNRVGWPIPHRLEPELSRVSLEMIHG